MADEMKPSIYTVDNDEHIAESSRELDKYGVWVKSAPQILSPVDSASQNLIQPIPNKEEDLASDLLQEPDHEAPLENISEKRASLEHPPINPSSSSEGKTLDNLSISKAENVPASDQKDITDSEPEKTLSYPPADLKEPTPYAESLGDTSMENPQGQASKPYDETPPLQPFSSDISIQLLTKIIEELSLIKNDIATIKQVLTRPEVSEEKQVELEPSASFEEEKITLTGNELNNILNAPDFTEPMDVPREGDLSIDDLNFLQEDPLAFEPLPLDDKALDAHEEVITPSAPQTETFIALENTEEFRRLREEGHKPIDKIASKGETVSEIETFETDPFEEDSFNLDEAPIKKNSEKAIPPENISDDALIDNLLIESGTIKDIPIELDLDEEDSNEEVFSFDKGEDTELPLQETTLEPFDVSSFFDEQPDMSDEDLDRIEKNILQEFLKEDDFLLDSDFSLEGVETVDQDHEGATKKNEDSDKEVSNNTIEIAFNVKEGLKTVLSYMDRLLESLPDDKIEEFSKSEYFDTYKKLFHELGLG